MHDENFSNFALISRILLVARLTYNSKKYLLLGGQREIESIILKENTTGILLVVEHDYITRSVGKYFTLAY